MKAAWERARNWICFACGRVFLGDKARDAHKCRGYDGAVRRLAEEMEPPKVTAESPSPATKGWLAEIGLRIVVHDGFPVDGALLVSQPPPHTQPEDLWSYTVAITNIGSPS